MERVKVDQQKLDYELDFIHSQQRELEELLAPLEKAVEQQPNINIQQHSALERENTWVSYQSDSFMKLDYGKFGYRYVVFISATYDSKYTKVQ